MLVTTIALAIAFHPASGSLIMGPTSRFWRFSPFSLIAEILAILFRLGEQINYTLGIDIDIGTCSGVSNEFSLSNAAYSMVIARACNGPIGARRGELQKLNTSEARMEYFKVLAEEINEGFKVRFAIGLPILAQFVKIVVMKGVVLPKVLGCLFFIHWVLVEVLIIMARPSRKDFSEGDTEDIVTRVDELLHISNKPPTHDEDLENTDIFEYQIYNLHSYSFLGSSLPLIFFFDSMAVGLLFLICHRWVLPVACIARNSQENKKKTQDIRRQFKTNNARLSMMLASLSYGGPNVGLSTGLTFFVAWVLWCILSFDGAGTERPSWPWLDWLG
ncbi:hypothetical protein K440DRAFT_609919 [Wilcoxina mikolae CBS 423.85]|nr:hypothetical protein K440DRAFT_609919 [Wilcoxina mikolae CBS 423.85]